MSETKELAVVQSTALAINNWDDLLVRAEFFAKSSLIPVSLRGKPADVAVILQMGMELGLSQMQSLNSIDCIQGKPTIPPQLGLALCRSKLQNFRVEWKELTESKATVVIYRGDESYPSTWDIARATKLGLMGKQNYQQQPGTMLKWRAVGEALRGIASDVLKGCYLEGELDIDTGGSNGASDAADKVSRLASLNKKPPTKDVVSEVTLPNGSTVNFAQDAPVDPIVSAPMSQGPKPEPSQTIAPPKVEPKVAPEAASDFNPHAEYTLQASHSLKGKKIGTIERNTLIAFLSNTRDHFQKRKEEIKGPALQDITRIDDYLRTTEAPSEWGNDLSSRV